MCDRRQLLYPYEPRWEGPIEGYTVNFLKKNFWRVSSRMEYEDAMQESILVFLRLKNKYGDVDTPQHFMALYKTTLSNHFTDLSVTTSLCRLEVLDSQFEGVEEQDYSGMINSIPGDVDNDGMLSTMITQAPAEIKMVLQLFISAPVEILDALSLAWKAGGKKKGCGNAHLCCTLGLKEGTDVVGMVSKYFRG